MQQEDYLLRLIRQVIQALAAIAQLRAASRQSEALAVVEEAYQSLLGADAAMIRVVGPALLAALAREKGVLEPLAAVIGEEAAIRRSLGDEAAAAALERRREALRAAAGGRRAAPTPRPQGGT